MSQTSSTMTAPASSLAGGVSASMRMHPYLGKPLQVSRGEGPWLFDLEGKRLLDFNMSNGAALLGHGHPAVEAAILEGVRAGIVTAAETPYHEQLAAMLVDIIPCAERVRFASTGSEVTVVALRIARNATGRSTFIKFDGHFHGLTEGFLFRRDEQGRSVASSGGVPAHHGQDVIILPWNDREAFERAMSERGDDIAAVIAEPVHYNAGCIPPEPGFLELLRERTTQHGIVLIFDEVLSGFRNRLGGIQEWSGVTPDLSTLAKALANGMPLSAVVGRADLMEQLVPNGPVAHSGTYSGLLLSVLAAIATIDELRKPGVYERLEETSERFYTELQAIFDRHDLPVHVQGLGARFGLYFGRADPVRSSADAAGHDHDMNRRFTLECYEAGLYFHAYTSKGPPGHCGFSLAHSEDELARALEIIDRAAAATVRGGGQ